ncbi:hypothetical protein CYQ59_11785 [Enterococcus faecium]|nr:hypothetical protein CYQ59_11785 [Enterococcus faecium]
MLHGLLSFTQLYGLYLSLLLILLTLMQYKEYPEYFILTFVYLVSSYTLLYKFRSSSRVSKVCFLISLLIL